LQSHRSSRHSREDTRLSRVVGDFARAFNGEKPLRRRHSDTVIAVDAMGSDRAPKPEIEGAIAAVRQGLAGKIILVGPEPLLREELAAHPTAADLFEIAHASEVISMHDKVATAVRSKRDSTLRVGLRLVREGKAAGFVSAGNTGAVMATAKMVLGALPGVDRPALAAVFPTATGNPAVMVDVGANVDTKPHNLVQFAIMGEIYSRNIFGVEHPRVGLLSIGEEEGKGNDLTRETLPLLKRLPLNFLGNVEGRDLYNGKADVVVCDGFIGNVALKVSEGLVETIRGMLKDSLQETLTRQVGYLLSRRAYTEFKKRLDYSEYGGAPLLGLKGICIVSHGSSNSNAIKNAIRVAAESADSHLNERIEKELTRDHVLTHSEPVTADESAGV
jgi:phosphate acyltransferase